MPPVETEHLHLKEAHWSQGLLEAITAIQRHYSPAARQSESVASILQTAMALTDSHSGMLAFVEDGEPCRIHEILAAGQSREQVLGRLDELARRALDRRSDVTLSDEEGDQLALLLRIGNDLHGVLAFDDVHCRPDACLIERLAPFCNTAAAVLRQFQDDLSSTQVGAVIDHLAEGVLTFDLDGRVQSLNAAAEQVFGYNADEIEGEPVSLLVAEPFATAVRDNPDGVLKMIDAGKEFEGRCKDGSVFAMHVSLSRIEVQGRELFVAITRDVSHYKEREREVEEERANTATLRQLARVDAVTTIANRRHFDETLEKEIRRAAREQHSLGLLLCDIDFFKAFNDRYGHPAGDRALRAVALAIDSCCQRAGELAARYGGEEFGVVIPGADLDSAATLATMVAERVAGLGIPHGASPVADQITVSVGVAATVPGPRFDPMQLVDEADRALYRAKGSGRNRVVLYEPTKTRAKLKAL